MLYKSLTIFSNYMKTHSSKLSLSNNYILKSNRISTFHQPYNCMSTKSTSTSSSSSPSFFYLQNPFVWLRNKLHMKIIKLALDPQFNESEFKRGVKQAVTVIAQMLQSNNMDSLRDLTTVYGLEQITADRLKSGDDPRMKLLAFGSKDVRKVMPLKIQFVQKPNEIDIYRCNIDAFIVVVRPIDQLKLDTQYDKEQIIKNLQRYEEIFPSKHQNDNNKKPIILIEIVMRFQKEFGTKVNSHWNVAKFKVVTFQILDV